ncbi:MAG: SGNH/GDSL hydrolase family protein, partial [Deltaproteobacteria bacterium]|nr:SGNH/GDSL hydrolase family protein [Deltaproteobacteria bacterium]
MAFALAASAGALLMGLLVCEAVLAVLLADREHALRLDEEINAGNWAVSQKHPFGFNEPPRSVQKPPGVAWRVAVVGDSFVWGDGVPSGESWSRKLEREVARLAPHVEVMSSGRSGWSTSDQL